MRYVLICDSAFTMKGFKTGTPSPLNGSQFFVFFYHFYFYFDLIAGTLCVWTVRYRSDIGQTLLP